MSHHTRFPIPRCLFVFVASLLLVWSATGCDRNKKSSHDSESAAQVEGAAPAVIVSMIEAHGGMGAWRAAPAVSFEDEWRSPGSDDAEISRVTVDQPTRRVYIDYPGSEKSIAWDGNNAWSMYWDRRTPPRFLALLNYYFANLPWLTMDPGVKLSRAGTATLWSDSTAAYDVVQMTFMPGTGDTPDDYYRLYVDPTTHRLKACDYVVTYRALLPDSVKSSPEHQLVYDEYATVNGLVVPTQFTIYGAPGEVMATCLLRDWSFGRPFDESRMTMPDSAVVDTTRP